MVSHSGPMADILRLAAPDNLVSGHRFRAVQPQPFFM
jgi:hypothetical protein